MKLLLLALFIVSSKGSMTCNQAIAIDVANKVGNTVTYDQACTYCYEDLSYCPSSPYDVSTIWDKSQYSCTKGGSSYSTPWLYDFQTSASGASNVVYCSKSFSYNDDDGGFSSSSTDDYTDDNSSSAKIIGGVIGAVAAILIFLGSFWYMKKKGYKLPFSIPCFYRTLSCFCGVPPCLDLEIFSILSFFKVGNITSCFKNLSIISCFKDGSITSCLKAGEVEEVEGGETGFCPCFSKKEEVEMPSTISVNMPSTIRIPCFSKKEEVEMPSTISVNMPSTISVDMPSSISKETVESYTPSVSITSSVFYNPSPPPRGKRSDVFLDISMIRRSNNR